MFDNMFNGIMGKVKNGCCRLSMNGKIAIKTSDGYKVYNEKTGNLTNCSNFVLDIADDMFMLIPTRNLNPGDICSSTESLCTFLKSRLRIVLRR